MTRLDQIDASIYRKHLTLDAKIETLAFEEFSGMNEIILYRLVKEKANMAKRVEA